jgi:hypothetical protein
VIQYRTSTRYIFAIFVRDLIDWFEIH